MMQKLVFQFSIFISFYLLLFCLHSYAQEYQLSLENTLQLALKNNEKIQQALLDYQIAAAEADAAGFDFDYQSTLSIPYKNEVTLSPYTYEDALITDKSYGVSVGLKTKFRLGTQLEAVLQSLKVNTTDSQSTLKDRSQMAGSLKLTQPLLKGAGRSVNVATENKAKFSSEKYKWKWMETIQEQLLKIGNLYWDLYSAAKAREIAQKSFQSAKGLFASEEASYQAGRKSRLDYLKAKANYSLSQAKMILAETDALEAEEKLAREIFPLKEKLEDFFITPTAVPEKLVQLRKKEKQLLNTAFTAHPKLNRLGMEMGEAEVDLKKANHNRLPQLDLSFQYLSTGVSAQTSSAFQNASRLKTPSIEIVLSFVMPIENSASEGDYFEKKSKYDSKALNLEKEKTSFDSNQNNLKNTLKQNLDILEALRTRLKNESEKLQAKGKLYQAGRLTWMEYLESLEDFQNLQKSEAKQYAALQKVFLKLEEYFSQISPGT